MSYPYRVTVSASCQEDVSTGDKVITKVAFDKIVPEVQMDEILCDVLKGKGWTETEPGKFSKRGEHGESMVFDTATKTVTTSASEQETIKRDKTVELMGDSNSRDVEGDKKRLREKGQRDLEAKLKITDEEKQQKKAELEKKVAKRLAAGEADRKREIDEIAEMVYGRALQKKAGTMGTIQSVVENRSDDGDQYEMTIKIAE